MKSSACKESQQKNQTIEERKASLQSELKREKKISRRQRIFKQLWKLNKLEEESREEATAATSSD